MLGDGSGSVHASATCTRRISLMYHGNKRAEAKSNKLRNEIDILNEQKQAGYCGSCYGGVEPESGCCNTCDEVRQSYVSRGWSFNNPDQIEQVRNVSPADVYPSPDNYGSAWMKVGQKNSKSRRPKDAILLV